MTFSNIDVKDKVHFSMNTTATEHQLECISQVTLMSTIYKQAQAG